mmetsp:Transcript_7288/g.13067  ORF Transcript_7288/g.13067 Transcript_7288/m.13067 type:complete len:204 (+) Transcript_7288:73-684(+)
MRGLAPNNTVLLLVVLVLSLSRWTEAFSPSCGVSRTGNVVRTTRAGSVSPGWFIRSGGPSSSAFVCSGNSRGKSREVVGLALVTEDDVLEAVDEAEELWAKALEARERANGVTETAEQEAQAASEVAQAAASELKQNPTNMSQENLTSIQTAMNSSIDASSILSDAIHADTEATELETRAEAALEKSQAALEQHLIDFPEEDS